LTAAGLQIGQRCQSCASLDTPSTPRTGRIDVLGALLATGSLVALIYALVEAPEAGWGSAKTLGLFAAALAGLSAFVAVEARTAAPLVPLTVFRRRPTVVALGLMVAGMGTVLSTFFFLTVYLQETLGHSALQTGLEFLPGAVVLVVAAHAGQHLVSRFGAKPVLAGGMTLGDAFRAATAAAAALLALVAVRRSDVAPGATAAFVH
jgi:Na+/melibiose symporter-like transporter